MDEQQYTKWFNLGYELSKHKPVLSDNIAKALSERKDERASGFRAGHVQYSTDKSKAMEPNYKNKLNYKPSHVKHLPVKNKDIEKDK